MKFQEKTSQEVFSNKHVNFAINRNWLEIWLFIENFLEKTSKEVVVFPKSSHCRKMCVWVLLLQLKNNSKTFNINEKTSKYIFTSLPKFYSGFWSNLWLQKKTSKDGRLLSMWKSNIVNCKSKSADFVWHWEDR